MIQIIKWILITVCVAMLCTAQLVTLYVIFPSSMPPMFRPAPPPPKTSKEVVNEEDLRYLTAIIAHRFGDVDDEKPKLLAGLAAKHTAKGLNKSYKAVFEGSLEQVPPGSSAAPWPIYWRMIDVVEGLRKGRALESSREVAQQILEDRTDSLSQKLPEKEQCVSTFHDTEGTSPAWGTDVKKMTDAPRVFTLPNGSFFACMPFPKKQ